MSLKDRTESIWEEMSRTPIFPYVSKNITTEVCIVGGGITGISIAYQMAKRGHKVTLVEAFQLGSGQTGRTTAHLTCQLESQFQELLKMHDVKVVTAFLDAHRTAIDVIEEIVKNEKIECDFKRVDGFLFRGHGFTEEKLNDEKLAGKKCGIHLDYISVTPLLVQPVSSLRFPKQAQFNPMKFIQGLTDILVKLGVNIFEGTHIRDMRQEDRENWLLLTDGGHQIESEKLIMATNTPVNNRFHIHSRQSAYRTYAMAFKITSKLKEECLLWDTENPYHYVRFVNDSLVVGGEDHRTGQEPEHDPFISLEDWSRKHFSFIKEIEWKWSGQVFEPADKISFIGKNPGFEKNCYISTGESGIGMTSAIIASLIIPELIQKGSHPWSKIFDPSRSSLRTAAKELIEDNLNTAYQYKDWISPPRVQSPEDIPIDSGSIMRVGMTKTCVYHQDSTNFEKKSAICTHLGGVVHWNDIEKTWDCPCHGSRFNTKGTVIEGPALSDLSET